MDEPLSLNDMIMQNNRNSRHNGKVQLQLTELKKDLVQQF